MSDTLGLIAPVEVFYLRDEATIAQVGPVVAARTLTRLLERTELTRKTWRGTELRLYRVRVEEGPEAGREGWGLFSRADLRAVRPDPSAPVPAEPAEPATAEPATAEPADPAPAGEDIAANITRVADALERQADEEPWSDGIVVAGRLVPIPGVEVHSFLARPDIVPRVRDGKRRTEPPASIVIHTVHGERGGLIEAQGAPSEAAERYGRYQAGTTRDVSWHLTVDRDSTVVCSADVCNWLCWHAPPTNAWSIGIELVQESNGDLYGPQLDTVVKLVTTLCDLFGIPKRVPVNGRGAPFVKPVKAWQVAVEGGLHQRWEGVLGHRNLTINRGAGDPGDHVFRRLLAAGFSGFSVV